MASSATSIPSPVPTASANYRASAYLGYFVAFICIGGFTLWAYLTQIDSAVVAGGQVVVDGHRQVIQNLEGGIVSFIGVKEGQVVEAGDILLNSMRPKFAQISRSWKGSMTLRGLMRRG